jgi:hypothetical protein
MKISNKPRMRGDSARLPIVTNHLFLVTLLGEISRNEGTIMILRDEYVSVNASTEIPTLIAMIPIIIGISSRLMYI